jgi:hypothetical protein
MVDFSFVPRADELPAKTAQDLRKPVEGSARLKRQTEKLKAKGAIEKTITAVKREDDRADREIRFFCFLRDHRKCRAFGTPLKFDTDNLKKRAHNHHIVFLSAGGSNDPSNRITLGPVAHQMIHDGLLEIVEPANANETVRFKEYEMRSGTRAFKCEWESAA